MEKIKRGEEMTIEEVVARNLSLSSVSDIPEWARKSYRIDRLDDAVALLKSRYWNRIHIVGDYDADGVTSTAELYLGLTSLGYSVTYRIPCRFSEGYGLNENIVDEIDTEGDVLLLTVDNGITAIDPIRKAKEKGYTVMVIDHHLPMMQDDAPVLPDANVIIDPHAIEGSADFDDYCGAGLAYRFIRALFAEEKRGMTEGERIKLEDLERTLLPLAAVGTIADVVELREENYDIVKRGLHFLEERKAPIGLLSLCDKLYVEHPTAKDIAFKIAPCINANGRLYDSGANTSVNLLICDNYPYADQLATSSVAVNKERKELVAQGMEKARIAIKKGKYENDLPMVLYLENICEGILGIIAGKLQDEYKTVVCVFTNTENRTLKGSARSTSTIHLKEFLDEFEEYFVQYGGHAGAAGMMIKKSNLSKFRKAANAYAKDHNLSHETETDLLYDLEIKAEDVQSSLDELLMFEPFGQGNASIMFKVTGFRLLENRGAKKLFVGENGVKMTCGYCDAIGFGLDERLKRSYASSLTLYGTLSYNYFRGKKTPQIEYIDFEEEKAEFPDTPLMQAVKARPVWKSEK